MAKYALIDVQNTDTTTKKILGFQVDWLKLYLFLKNNWQCEKVFFYTGVDEGDIDTAKMLEELERQGCTIRAKTVFAYKNKDKNIDVICLKCQNKFIEHVDMGYNRKSNCDVELSVDAMELAKKDDEFYLFTGDGDFEFLIHAINHKGARAHIVSNGRKIKTGPRYFTSRLSTKLRKLAASNPTMVSFIDINNLKLRIQK